MRLLIAAITIITSLAGTVYLVTVRAQDKVDAVQEASILNNKKEINLNSNAIHSNALLINTLSSDMSHIKGSLEEIKELIKK